MVGRSSLEGKRGRRSTRSRRKDETKESRCCLLESGPMMEHGSVSGMDHGFVLHWKERELMMERGCLSGTEMWKEDGRSPPPELVEGGQGRRTVGN